MVALYIILGAFVIAFLYVTIYGNRLYMMSRQITPDSFKEKKSDEKKEGAQPLYPQRV
jgi:Na+-transporting methylmalonyl-CoA/oxaloacetate decarboxylase gamma subunit